MSLEGNELLKRLRKMKVSGEAAKLRVLDAKNDPFWLSPARVRDAKWIAKIWYNKVKTRTYDRGLHYKLLSYGVKCPWGKQRRVYQTPLYINVDSDFNKLVGAIRDARNWGLLPWDAIEDRKHVGLERWVNWGWLEGNREKRPFEDFDGSLSYMLGVFLPEVQEIDEAEFVEDNFDEIAHKMVEEALTENMTDLTSTRYQPYYVAIASEKSGLRSVVRNALEKLNYGFDFLNFEGQPSATIVRDFIFDRLLKEVPPEHPVSQKKIRIFYISDYDYSGRTMPPAFIQKLFFDLWALGKDLDIKVKPLALTREIVGKYDLPPAPVPERSLGAKTLQDRWLREFGKIVEVDALVALHPGVLEEIIVNEVMKYIDLGLARKVRDEISYVRDEAEETMLEAINERKADWMLARAKLLRAMNALNEDIKQGRIREQLEVLKTELEELSRRYNIDELVKEYQATLEDVYVDYEAPDLKFESDFEADEGDNWLFDSKRDPVEQARILREYKP